MERCRACGADILFIRMKSGKYNPVDPEKKFIIQDGGRTTLITKSGEIIHGTPTDEMHANGSGYVSHFATCPAADRFRREK